MILSQLLAPIGIQLRLEVLLHITFNSRTLYIGVLSFLYITATNIYSLKIIIYHLAMDEPLRDDPACCLPRDDRAPRILVVYDCLTANFFFISIISVYPTYVLGYVMFPNNNRKQNYLGIIPIFSACLSIIFFGLRFITMEFVNIPCLARMRTGVFPIEGEA